MTALPHPHGVPYIARKFYQAPLTIEAQAIYVCFSYLTDPETNDRNQTIWTVDIGVDQLAEICFRSSYPYAKVGSLRRKVCAAISELEHYGMIAKIRALEVGKTNRYCLMESEQWNFSNPLPDGNCNVRRSRVRSVDLSGNTTSLRSPEDQHLYLKLSERESEVGEKQPDPWTAQQPAQLSLFEQTETPDLAIDSTQNFDVDNSSSAPKLTQENFEKFDFRTFEFGETGSHPGFSLWITQWGKKRQKQRRFSRNPICNFEEWLAVTLHNNGRDYFRVYLRETGQLPTESPATTSQKIPEPKLSQEQLQEREHWQRSGQKLEQLYRQGETGQLYDCLNRLTGAVSNCIPNPEKLKWLLEAYPHWGLTFSEGHLHHSPEAELLQDFLKLTEQGLQHRSSEDIGLGLAGLRSIWQEGSHIAHKIRQWCSRWPGIVLGEQGPCLGGAT